MYGDSGKPPINSSRLLVIFIMAIVVVMIGTVVLNGGFSGPTATPEDSSNNTTVETATPSVQYKMLGSNSYGTVTKISGYGNPSSDIKCALIVGVDSAKKSANAIVPTLQSEDMLNYCYDIYLINTTSISNDSADANANSNMTVNEMSESLASEFVVPDIINNNYNFTVDIHSTNDSNSYVFVPSENTYTSKSMVDSISKNTDVGKYTPDNHAYTESISEKIISNDIPSIVYVTRDYYSNNTSVEISSVINTIDRFDFLNLFNSSSDNATDDYSYDSNSNSSGSNSTSYKSNSSTNTVTVSNSSGNVEVN
ncbi:MAG: hypothetical protein BZ138_02610 [Methanosphaera sp. rholeuAM270]|nr:MAG: hypothetical protein BZ138_02610 [Methanosphaera sp. rholeuAM270]